MEPPLNPATARPELGTEALAMFKVRLGWQRYDFGGLELQSQRAAEADWTSLGLKTAVEAATIKAVRNTTAKREDSWTQAELLKLP